MKCEKVGEKSPSPAPQTVTNTGGGGGGQLPPAPFLLPLRI